MTAEEAMKEYPKWLNRKKLLEMQIKNLQSILEIDVIDTMTFSQPNEERVKSNKISDKTARTALMYKSLAAKERKEAFKNLNLEYERVCYEIDYFECCVSTLKNYLPGLMLDLATKKYKWNEIAKKYIISHAMVGKCRKNAIKELDVFYSEREKFTVKVD